MNQEKVSIIATLVNLLLALLKLGAGYLAKSAALIADGIHSGLDIASSLVTYLGTRAARKPIDKEHPYGHYRAETIAGFIVAILLFVSAAWIMYEGVLSIINQEKSEIGYVALGVVVFSIIINELMARLKFKVGRKNNNLALIGDAKHSRADSISSAAVLVGLALSFWYFQADGIAAIVVGLYILYETYELTQEVTENLMDVANPEIEEEIHQICQNQEVEVLEIKTRKVGPRNFAELKIGLKKDWRMEKVEQVVGDLQSLLIEKIDSLEFVTIQVASHELTRGYVKSTGGQVERFQEKQKKTQLKKKGYRVIVPIEENGKIHSAFGAPKYLIIDKDKDNKVIQEEVLENPYFAIGRGHGIRFIRDIKADKLVIREIGDSARKTIESLGVEIEITQQEQINNLRV